MKVCLFSHYNTEPNISNYVKLYLEELKRHNDRVICITNNRDINDKDLTILADLNIDVIKVENEGFDFGMWYKILLTLNMFEITQLTLANDSCVLFRKLDSVYNWCNESNLDVCSLTDSYEKSYHLQSYFLVFKTKTIEHVFNYFIKNKIIADLEKVINTYEIGLSTYLLEKGFKIGSYYDATKMQHGLLTNISIYFAKELIELKSPMIKKKVLFKSFRDEETAWLKHVGYNFSFNYIEYVSSVMFYDDENISPKFLFKL